MPRPLPSDLKALPAPARAWLAERTDAGRAPTWTTRRRPEQAPPPGDWTTWLIMTGRGWGKTRAGAEWAWRQARDLRGSRGTLVGPTAADVRDTMIEGESGLLACVHPAMRPDWEPSKRRLTFPNGSIITTYSAEKPDRLRGPQSHWGWLDEPAFYDDLDALLAMYRFGLRLGTLPRTVMTTTPRPMKALRALATDPGTVVTRGSTYDNLPNLAPPFARAVLARYEGTRLGRQEIMGELLDDTEGALWTPAMIDACREPVAPELLSVVVGVDPAVTSGESSDETGIVVAGRGADGRCHVLADLSGRFTPAGWAHRVAVAYDEHGADRVVAEVNNGGDLVVETLRRAHPGMRVVKVHASRGKLVRAEPVAALYEQGRVGHLPGLRVLEDQLTEWVPGQGASPDRMDALVWAITALTSRDLLRPVQGFAT